MQDTAARPLRARSPPLHILLPEQSRRQPRATKAQSVGIAWDKPRQRGAEGPAGSALRASPARRTWQPRPSARPAPPPPAPANPRPLADFLHSPGPGSLARKRPQGAHQSKQKPLPKLLLRAET